MCYARLELPPFIIKPKLIYLYVSVSSTQVSIIELVGGGGLEQWQSAPVEQSAKAEAQKAKGPRPKRAKACKKLIMRMRVRMRSGWPNGGDLPFFKSS